MCRRLFCLLAATGFVFLSTVHAGEPLSGAATDEWTGREVLARSQQVKLRERPDACSPVIETSPHGILFTVDREEGGWLRLAPGWMKVDDVVVVKQAVEHFSAQLAQAENVFGHLGRARGWLSQDDHDRALADVSEALRLDPENARAVLVRGEIAAARQRHDDALADYQRAVGLDPRDPFPLVSRARGWSERGDFDRAIADLTSAIALAPADARLRARRGWCHARKGDSDKALSDFSEAIRVDPENAYALSRRAAVHLHRKEFEQAMADADAAVRLDPKMAYARAIRGEIFVAQGKLAEALAEVDESLRLDASEAPVHKQRGLIHSRQGDIDAAILDYTQAIALNSADAAAYYQRANLWFWKHDPANAAIDLTEYLRLKPDDTNARVLRGLLRLDSDTDDAMLDFNEALRINPRSVGALQGIATVWQRRHENEKALQTLKTALAIAPENAAIYGQRAQFWSSLQKWDNAIADLDQVTRLKAQDASAFCERAKCRLALRQYDKAIRDANEALRLDPNTEEAAAIRCEAEDARDGVTVAMDDKQWVGHEVLPKRAEVAFQGDEGAPLVAAAGILLVTHVFDDSLYVNQGLLEKKQFVPLEQAELYFSKRIEREPTAFAYAMRGRARADLGRPDAGIADCDAALKLDADCALAWCNRGWAHAARLDYAAAIDDYAQAIRIDPKLAAAFAWRGRARQRLGQTKLAIEDFDLALKLLPNDFATQNRRSLASPGDGAYSYGGRSPRPRDAEDFYLRAKIGTWGRRPASAMNDVNEALRLGLKTSDVFAYRAVLELQRREFSKAVIDYTRALILDADGSLYLQRGLVHGYLGDYSKALADFRQGLDLDVQAADSVDDNWSEDGPFQKLISESRAQRDDPSLPGAYGTRAMMWISKGEYEDAIDDLGLAIECDSKLAVAYCLRGWCKYKLGEGDDARRDLAEALRLEPTFVAARELDRTPALSVAAENAEYQAAFVKMPPTGARYTPPATITDIPTDTIPVDAVVAEYGAAGSLGDKAWPVPPDTELAPLSEALRNNPDDEDAREKRQLILISLTNRALRLSREGQFEKALGDISKVIAAEESNSRNYDTRGQIFAESGDYAKALDDFQQSLRLADRFARPMAHVRLAWLWATCPDSRLRDGPRAVKSAKKALRSIGYIPPHYYETLAAAYAECADFGSAIEWQTKALEVAKTPEDYREQVQKRLELYRAGRPHRDPQPPCTRNAVPDER